MVALIALFAGIGCSSVDDVYQSKPVVTGNTIERYNDLEVVHPHEQSISVSYLYALEGESELALEGAFEGVAWLYAEEAPSTPEKFLYVHLVVPDRLEEERPQEVVILGNVNFKSELYCVDPRDPALPKTLRPYLTDMQERGLALSADILVRRFTGAALGLDGRRFDILHIHDIARSGHDCAALGDDPLLPPEEVQDAVEVWKTIAERSFELIG